MGNVYKSLYIKCTDDEFEFPIIIEDSPSRIDNKMNLSKGTTTRMINKGKNGQDVPYHKINYTKEEWEE